MAQFYQTHTLPNAHAHTHAHHFKDHFWAELVLAGWLSSSICFCKSSLNQVCLKHSYMYICLHQSSLVHWHSCSVVFNHASFSQWLIQRYYMGTNSSLRCKDWGTEGVEVWEGDTPSHWGWGLGGGAVPPPRNKILQITCQNPKKVSFMRILSQFLQILVAYKLN